MVKKFFVKRKKEKLFVFCCFKKFEPREKWQKCSKNFQTYLFYLFIFYFLAALGLSCGMRDLHCGMWDLLLQRVGSSLWHRGFSLVVACGFSLPTCGAQAPERVDSSLRHVGSLVEVRRLRSCGTRA